MGPAIVLDGPSPSARRRQRRTWILAGVVVTIVVAAAVVAALTPSSPSRQSGGRFGPYTLGTWPTTGMVLAFPLCSIVTAHWNVTFGTSDNATFTVWTPQTVRNSTCAGTPPTMNLTCPEQGCPRYVGQPVCIEWGLEGTCSFQSTQTNYTFLIYLPFSQSVFPSLEFVANYT